jgi:tyrosinase
MADGVTLRDSIESVEQNPSALRAVRNAYGKMQELTDNRGWTYWAGLHGVPQFLCWHHGRVGMGDTLPYNLFLPWHRAYLLYFEHSMRDQDPDARLPWWDWTSPGAHQVGIPRSYSVPQVDGVDNSLFSGPMPPLGRRPARNTQRAPRSPHSLPTSQEVDDLLTLGNFEDFTSQVEEIHDRMHVWVGGDMGVVATAAYDPIFWSHHCMIDRIWYLWQLDQHNTVPPDYLDKALAPFALTVRDVLDINRLGYEYAQASVSVDA